MLIRPIEHRDREGWQPLWDGYNRFYERAQFSGEITQATWNRFFDAREPVFAAVAERDGKLVGLAHYLFHPSTTTIEDVCYLQDLFAAPEERNKGVGRALIQFVYEQARAAGCKRVYWQTHEDNPARRLYDQLADLTPFRRYAKQL